MLWPGNKTIQLTKECCSALLAQAHPQCSTFTLLLFFHHFSALDLEVEFAEMRRLGLPTIFINSYVDMEEEEGGEEEVEVRGAVYGLLVILFNYTSDLMVHTYVSCFTVGGRRQWPPPISTCSPCAQVQRRKREERWPSQFMERLPPEGTPCKMEAEYHSSCEGDYFTWTRLLW